jgi:DNA-binding IclR family transcriptional regulator
MIDRLQARGYILRDPATGSIELTLRLYELAHSHSVTGRFLRAARDPMERFAAATGHSCHLGVRHGGNLLILMERLPVHRVCLAVGEGSIQPLFRSNSGRLILAGMGSEAPRLLGKDPAFLALGASQRKSFLASLAGILPDDVLTAGSLLNPGVRDLAVSAGIQGTDAAAVLATPILAETDPGRIREELLAAAQEIRKGMGLGGA